jgi:hypothetical protein
VNVKEGRPSSRSTVKVRRQGRGKEILDEADREVGHVGRQELIAVANLTSTPAGWANLHTVGDVEVVGYVAQDCSSTG